MKKKSRRKQGLPKATKAVPSQKGAADKNNPIEVYPMREAVHRLEDALEATYKRLGLR